MTFSPPPDVEATLNVVKILTEKNELAKREEFILSAGYCRAFDVSAAGD